MADWKNPLNQLFIAVAARTYTQEKAPVKCPKQTNKTLINNYFVK
jgi:hypothetical protein